MNDSQLPATLGEAMATEPWWLQAWVMVLVLTHLSAILFLPTRRAGGGLGVRLEPLAVLVAFGAAGMLMDWLYDRVGYVRLLGLAHLVFWGPAWIWVLTRRRSIPARSAFGRWVLVYVIVAGTSLVIDLVDVVRYLAGDGELLHRWR